MRVYKIQVFLTPLVYECDVAADSMSEALQLAADKASNDGPEFFKESGTQFIAVPFEMTEMVHQAPYTFQVN